MEHRLHVWSNGRPVGVIAFDDSTDTFSLAYDPEWLRISSFPLSPRLMAEDLDHPRSSLELRRFLENLLPEGQALDDVIGLHKLSKSNLFGLIRALGKESAGALSFLPEGLPPEKVVTSKREIGFQELSERIRSRTQIPFSVWDGRVRMSIAGYQDKIAVFRDGNGRLFLVEGALASTHILKPTPRAEVLRHLVVNEFYCMSLVKQSGLDVAEVELLRVPEPVLLIERFDRAVSQDGNHVERIHVIDGCQALGMPPHYKYERNFGPGVDVRHVRDGVSLPKLFNLIHLSDNKSAEIMKLLRWTLFQYVIGNVDAHGKNISYFFDEGGLRLAPAYDLVAGEMHDCYSHDIGMGIGDEFLFANVRAIDWAEFGCACGIQRRLLEREMTRLAKAVSRAIDRVAIDTIANDEEESAYLHNLVAFIRKRVERLAEDAKLLHDISDDMLNVSWRP